MKPRRSILLAVVLFIASACAQAHRPSDSYLTLDVDEAGVRISWAIALRDLEKAVGLDANGDGDITWAEVQAAYFPIYHYADTHLTIAYDGQPQVLDSDPLQIDHKSDGAYAVLGFNTVAPAATATVDLGYRLLFGHDPTHRGLINYRDRDRQISRVAGPQDDDIRFSPGEPATLDVLGDYFTEGVWHIWIGFDHILFLVVLLLPAVFLLESGRWQPVSSPHAAFLDAVKVITAFTLAHSITLALAVLNIVSLPSWLVESCIALSVLLAALNNLHPVFPAARWQLAFLFGLVHGFGFATVLVDLGLPGISLATALVGFNLGVEAGQVLIVMLFFPLAVLLRHSRVYRLWIFRGGSVVAALVAVFWLVDRLPAAQWLVAMATSLKEV